MEGWRYARCLQTPKEPVLLTESSLDRFNNKGKGVLHALAASSHRDVQGCSTSIQLQRSEAKPVIHSHMHPRGFVTLSDSLGPVLAFGCT